MLANATLTSSFLSGEQNVLYFDRLVFHENPELLSFTVTVRPESGSGVLSAFLPYDVKPNLSAQEIKVGTQAYLGHNNWVLEKSFSLEMLESDFKLLLDNLFSQSMEHTLASGNFVADTESGALIRLERAGTTKFNLKCKILGKISAEKASDERWTNFFSTHHAALDLAKSLSKSKSEPEFEEVFQIQRAWKALLDRFGAPNKEFKTLADIVVSGALNSK